MVTIRTVQNIKLGARITFYNGIYAIIIGLFYFIFSSFLLKVNFNAVDASWGFFDHYNANISSIFGRLFILVGLIIISVGLSIMYLSHIVKKKKERDFWLVLFVIGGVFWNSLFVIEILNKNIYSIIFTFLGLFSFIIGMIIPIRYYLAHPEDRY